VIPELTRFSQQHQQEARRALMYCLSFMYCHHALQVVAVKKLHKVTPHLKAAFIEVGGTC